MKLPKIEDQRLKYALVAYAGFLAGVTVQSYVLSRRQLPPRPVEKMFIPTPCRSCVERQEREAAARAKDGDEGDEVETN